MTNIANSALVYFLLYSENGSIVGAQVVSMGSSIEGLKESSDDILRDVDIDPSDVAWKSYGNEFMTDEDKQPYRRYVVDGVRITHVIAHSFMSGAGSLPI